VANQAPSPRSIVSVTAETIDIALQGMMHEPARVDASWLDLVAASSNSDSEPWQIIPSLVDEILAYSSPT
jgi:hypothetical protein